MSDTKEKCASCIYHAICKYSRDYAEFSDKIYDLSNKLNGEIIAEGVAQIEIKCKYFRSITSTPRS